MEKSSTDEKPKTKSDETRARILGAAMDLFRRRGFEETTMREIAAEAGVATGAAYYYFDSKDAIVLAFYDQAQQEMAPLLETALAGSKDLKERMRGLLDVKLAYFEPNRRLLGALAAHTDPQHPLSPFSSQTRAIRERDIQSFHRALEGCRVRIPRDFEELLPRILWMYQMGLILFWIYDRSPSQKRTRALVDKSLAIVVRLVKLSDLPLMRPVRRIVIDLVKTVTEEP
ncbi:Transcriptional regulator, TetR family [Candidatus Sulfopaludibacter sp. SbA4]|nr:Transcriptional regulator, TetR family [Candidatus Sulfopaludibacter sp. SbA4]